MNGALPGSAKRRPNLALRIGTAAIGLPVVVGLIWLGGWGFAIAIGIVALLAGIEFMHGWLTPSMPIREGLRLGMAPVVCAAMAAGAHGSTRYIILGIAFAAMLAAIGYSQANAFGPRKPFRVQAWCLLYIGVPLGAAVLIRDGWHGREWLYLLVLSTFAVDTGAYATGKLIGRHKMAPRISPGKTWEGAAGGYAAGVAVVLALAAMLDTTVPVLTVVPLAVLLPAVTQAGDLFESWMKRRMGVKDASGLLPGHGGFLDRLDSLLPAAVLLWVFLEVRVW